MPYKDPEKQKAAQHRSYLKNKEKISARKIKWRDDNRERKIETDRAWRARNPEKVKEQAARAGRNYRQSEGGKAFKKAWKQRYGKTDKGKMARRKLYYKRTYEKYAGAAMKVSEASTVVHREIKQQKETR